MPIPKKDLDELLHANVISPETAGAIHNYYHDKKATAANPLLAIFGALGGVLVGLGIILIFAHNWDNFSRQVKTLLAFTPLVLSQAFAAWCIVKNKTAVFKETAAVLIFFAVGASISLVAQVYNISGDFPRFLLTWALLCTPLMYLLRSNAAVVLHLIFSTWYAAEAGYSFRDTTIPWTYLLFIAALAPVYHRHLKENNQSHMTVTLNWLLPLSFCITFGAFMDGADEFVYFLYMAFFGLLYVIGYSETLGEKPNGYRAIGQLGVIVLLFFGSFRFTWGIIINSHNHYEFLVIWMALLACSGFVIFSTKTWRDRNYFKWVPFLFPILYGIGLASESAAATVTNLILLAVGLYYIRTGITAMEFRTVNFGLTLIAILTACRFFDTDLSFVVRGVMFVGVGLGFFAANYTVAKRKKETVTTEPYEN
ncbi:DUF2157 domain-containing protein [Flavobacterium sp. RHBU_24]|uniref:DUF2157 domain-containing protein n=1 Tax=Flavobacterium sp. RHBU_24 TaxID=3391185 RepID=UPI003984EC38